MDQWLKDEIECAAGYWEHAISGDAGQPYIAGTARGGLPVPDRADVRVFTGSNATSGYWARTWLDGVSIADLPGVPIVGDHWTVWLWGELMYSSVVMSFGGTSATRVTLGAFEDIGYEVDYSFADSPCDSDHPIIDPAWRSEYCP